MSLKIVRNDITKMKTEAIVNTASETPEVGAGCDIAIYKAAGFDKLHALREEIGNVPEGEVFITPGFNLPAKYIIHAVSPYYIDGSFDEEEKLRSCYRKSLLLAKENGIESISFPLIATGSFGYPRAHGLRIAVDEINTFLLENEMEVYLVVFDSATTELAEKIYPQIEAFLNHSDVCKIREEEYGMPQPCSSQRDEKENDSYIRRAEAFAGRIMANMPSLGAMRCSEPKPEKEQDELIEANVCAPAAYSESDSWDEFDFDKIKERASQIEDTFGHYVMHLAERNNIKLTTLEHTVWLHKNKVSNVRNKPDTYRPDKRTALQFAVGLELSLDDTKDLLARAGYALSPSYLEDVIWETFIQAEHYDIFDISDTLKDYGFKQIVPDFE